MRSVTAAEQKWVVCVINISPSTGLQYGESAERVLCPNRYPAGEEEEERHQPLPSSVLLGLNFFSTQINLRRSLLCCIHSSMDVVLVEGEVL